MVDAELDCATLDQLATEHARGVETPCELTAGGQTDYAAVAMDCCQIFVYYLIHGLLQRYVCVLHEGADAAGDSEPDKVLAGTRGGDGARLI